MRSRTQRLPIFLLFSLLVLSACSNVFEPGEVRIRVRNASAIDFQSTTINFSNQEEQYGALAAGGSTTYRTVGRAYRYAYVEVRAGGNRYVLQPIDYVGEELLRPGSYTYELTIDSNASHLTLRLVKD